MQRRHGGQRQRGVDHGLQTSGELAHLDALQVGVRHPADDHVVLVDFDVGRRRGIGFIGRLGGALFQHLQLRLEFLAHLRLGERHEMVRHLPADIIGIDDRKRAPQAAQRRLHRQRGPAESDGLDFGGELQTDACVKASHCLQQALPDTAVVNLEGSGPGQRQGQQPHAVGEAAQVRLVLRHRQTIERGGERQAGGRVVAVGPGARLRHAGSDFGDLRHETLAQMFSAVFHQHGVPKNAGQLFQPVIHFGAVGGGAGRGDVGFLRQIKIVDVVGVFGHDANSAITPGSKPKSSRSLPSSPS